ncbi:BolA domain UV induced protein Uvi31 [Thecaphora frezii]
MRPSAFRSLAQSASSLSQRRLVRVQLLADTPGLGKVGQVCLVQPGRMRNDLEPHKKAIYQPLLTPTTQSRQETADRLLEQQLQEAQQRLKKQEAREQLQKELGALQLLSLRRKLANVPTITYSRPTTIPSTAPAGQLPSPPLTIQGSIAVHEVVNYIRDQHGVFDLETDFSEPGSSTPLNKLTPQQISTTCEFKLVQASDNKEPEALDKSGRIKKTGKYNLQAHIVPSNVKVLIPIVVRPPAPVSTASSSSSARMSSTPSGVRAFSTSRSAPAPTGVEASMRSKIERAFGPAEINIRNDSNKHAHHAAMAAQGGGNGETHFFVEIISDAFEGMAQIKRHRAVNALMADEFERGLHALSLRTKTRKEVERANQTTTITDPTSCSTPPHPPPTVSSLLTAPQPSLHPSSPPSSEDAALQTYLRQSAKFFRRVTKDEQAPPANWQRIANLVAAALGTASTFYLVAMADFGEKEHCFKPVRRMLFDDEKGWNPWIQQEAQHR